MCPNAARSKHLFQKLRVERIDPTPYTAGPHQAKTFRVHSSTRKMSRFRFMPRMRKVSYGHLLPLIHSEASNDSVSGK